MEQKQEYIDYQPVNPSPLPHEVEYSRSNTGVNTPKSSLSIPHQKGLVLVKKAYRWAKSEPVKRTLNSLFDKGFFAAAVGIVCGLVFMFLYWVGIALTSLIAQFKAWLESGGAVILATGAAGILFLLIVGFIISNTKKTVKFDDWNPQRPPRRKARQKGVEQVHKGQGIVINQIVNIDSDQCTQQ